MSTQPYAKAIAAEWQRRVQAEYSSAARTHVFTHWLIQLGASPDLIRAGLRIVDDELAHAELSAAVVAQTQVERSAPALAQESLDLPRRHPGLLEDVVWRCVEIFCLGETVAVPLFSAMRAGCDEAVARAALDRILVDEVRHRDFGWTTLAWLLHTADAPVRAALSECLEPSFRRVRANYASEASDLSAKARPEESTEQVEALQRWGLIPATRYAAILERCAQRDYLPRFAKLNVDARTAWEAARHPAAT